MRRRTRHAVVYASIVALLLLELSGTQQGGLRKRAASEMGAATRIGVGPLLFRPRVLQPPQASISVPAVNLPGVVTISHAGHLSFAIGESLSLQEEHVRLQI
jgi:hypothetical protein